MASGIKTGGRKEGTPNKLTKELRAILKDVIYNELETLPERFEALEPKDRIELLIKLLPFTLPKIEPVNATANEPISFDF